MLRKSRKCQGNVRNAKKENKNFTGNHWKSWEIKGDPRIPGEMIRQSKKCLEHLRHAKNNNEFVRKSTKSVENL